jgi:hypothetical protein
MAENDKPQCVPADERLIITGRWDFRIKMDLINGPGKAITG